MENDQFEPDFNHILYQYFDNIRTLRKARICDDNEYESEHLNAKCENLIDQAVNIINKVVTKEVNLTTIRLMAMKTTLLCECAKMLSINQNENRAIELLSRCLGNVKLHLSNPFVIYLAMKIINFYAYLNIKHENNEDALVALELTEKTYKEYFSTESHMYYTSEDLFLPFFVTPSNKHNKLEHIVINNYKMLVYVYAKLGIYDKYLYYQHTILERQYKLPNNDQLIWSNEVINLALNFLKNNRFEEARHHLSVAVYVLYEYEKVLKAETNSQANTHRWEKLHKVYYDVATGWVQYGLHIFSVSRCKTLEEMHKKFVADLNESTDISKQYQEFSQHYLHISDTNINSKIELPKSVLNTEDKLFFKSLSESYIESQVPATLIFNITYARVLFHHTYEWLKRLKITLNLQEHPIRYMNAVLYLSELYKLLAFYEENMKVEYALAKLRSDVVETFSQILQEIHPESWTTAEPLIFCELSEIQMELVGLNMRRLHTTYETLLDINHSKFYEIVKNVSDLQRKLYQLNIRPINFELFRSSN